MIPLALPAERVEDGCNDDTCRLCGAELAGPAPRCRACGMHRARDMTRAQLWRIGAGLVAVYALTALLLVLR